MEYQDTPQFRAASRAAAHLVNVVLPPGEPGSSPGVYSKLVYAILAAIYEAAEDAREVKLEPSEN